jgi:hypothetical protein
LSFAPASFPRSQCTRTFVSRTSCSASSFTTGPSGPSRVARHFRPLATCRRRRRGRSQRRTGAGAMTSARPCNVAQTRDLQPEVERPRRVAGNADVRGRGRPAWHRPTRDAAPLGHEASGSLRPFEEEIAEVTKHAQGQVERLHAFEPNGVNLLRHDALTVPRSR